MGCDIHLYAEHREPGGPWQWTEPLRTDVHDYREVAEPYYQNRNYDVFAILADVRNGRGFAGTPTGLGFVPIVGPRGLPDDLSPKLTRWFADESGGDHSASWLTVAELMAYDWTQTTHKRGLAELREWARATAFRRPPESYCAAVGGGGVVCLEHDEVSEALKGVDLYDIAHDRNSTLAKARELLPGVSPHNSVYVEMRWQVHYYEVAQHFLSHALPRLWRLGTPEDVRIVFNFDS